MDKAGQVRMSLPASKDAGLAALETRFREAPPSDTRPLSELHGCFKKKTKASFWHAGG